MKLDLKRFSANRTEALLVLDYTIIINIEFPKQQIIIGDSSYDQGLIKLLMLFQRKNILKTKSKNYFIIFF